MEYALDLTATLAANYVEDSLNREHVGDWPIALPGGAFFTKDLIVTNRVTGRELVPMVQFRVLHTVSEAVLASGKEVCALILITDESVSQVTIKRRIVGGPDWSVIGKDVEEIVERLRLDRLNSTAWGQVLGAPKQFPSEVHTHHGEDIYGLEEVVYQLECIATAISTGDSNLFGSMIQYIDRNFAATVASINERYAIMSAEIEAAKKSVRIQKNQVVFFADGSNPEVVFGYGPWVRLPDGLLYCTSKNSDIGQKIPVGSANDYSALKLAGWRYIGEGADYNGDDLPYEIMDEVKPEGELPVIVTPTDPDDGGGTIVDVMTGQIKGLIRMGPEAPSEIKNYGADIIPVYNMDVVPPPDSRIATAYQFYWKQLYSERPLKDIVFYVKFSRAEMAAKYRGATTAKLEAYDKEDPVWFTQLDGDHAFIRYAPPFLAASYFVGLDVLPGDYVEVSFRLLGDPVLTRRATKRFNLLDVTAMYTGGTTPVDPVDPTDGVGNPAYRDPHYWIWADVDLFRSRRVGGELTYVAPRDYIYSAPSIYTAINVQNGGINNKVFVSWPQDFDRYPNPHMVIPRYRTSVSTENGIQYHMASTIKHMDPNDLWLGTLKPTKVMRSVKPFVYDTFWGGFHPLKGRAYATVPVGIVVPINTVEGDWVEMSFDIIEYDASLFNRVVGEEPLSLPEGAKLVGSTPWKRFPLVRAPEPSPPAHLMHVYFNGDNSTIGMGYGDPSTIVERGTIQRGRPLLSMIAATSKLTFAPQAKNMPEGGVLVVGFYTSVKEHTWYPPPDHPRPITWKTPWIGGSSSDDYNNYIVDNGMATHDSIGNPVTYPLKGITDRKSTDAVRYSLVTFPAGMNYEYEGDRYTLGPTIEVYPSWPMYVNQSQHGDIGFKFGYLPPGKTLTWDNVVWQTGLWKMPLLN